MERIKFSICLLALGLTAAGAGAASAGQNPPSNKPVQLAQHRFRGFWVCYPRRFYRGHRWRYRHRRHFVGCAIHPRPCFHYGKNQFRWFRHYRYARHALWRCNRSFYYR